MAAGRPPGIEIKPDLIDQMFVSLGRSYQDIADLCGNGLTRQAVYTWRSKRKVPAEYLYKLIQILKSENSGNDSSRTELVTNLEQELGDFIELSDFKADRESTSHAHPLSGGGKLRTLSDQELVEELERRGWQVTLQLRR